MNDIFLERVLRECKTFFVGGPGTRYQVYRSSGMGNSSLNPFNQGFDMLVARGELVYLGKAGDIGMSRSGIKRDTDIFGLPGQTVERKKRTTGVKAPAKFQKNIFVGELGKSPTVFKPMDWRERMELCEGIR